MNFHLLFAICAVCVLARVEGRHRAVRATSTVAEQLRSLLQEEAALRGSLEARVQALRAETRKTNGAIVPCNCPQVLPSKPRGPSIAYTGTLPAYLSSMTASTVINLSNDLINVGQPFNVTSGHFVAPVSGLYGFSLAVYMTPPYWTDLQLVRNGSPILYARTGHYKASTTDRQVNMGTNYAIVMLNATDEVWPQYKSSSNTNLYADGVTTFSGVLLNKM